MKFGPILFYSCPSCSVVHSKMSLLSGNTFDAITWSDGHQFAPMLIEFTHITKCSGCGTIFWLDDRTEVEHSSEDTTPSCNFLKLYEYQEFLSTAKTYTSEEERYLRTKFWRGMNNRVRKNEELFQNLDDERLWKDNLMALLDLIGTSETDELIWRAEIYRNLGEFEESKKILQRIDDSELNWLVEAFEKEINAKNTKVFVFE